MNTHSKQLEDTAIWETYVTKLPADSFRSSWVRQIYDASVMYLADVRRSFPNYTLHDKTHVLNVLDAMAGILGDQISLLSEGEAEMLILAACLHDLGMVYTDEEVKQCFENKRLTREFLRINNPELIGCPADEWLEDIRQWYLRWLHPFRLWEVLRNEGWNELLASWPSETAPKRCVLAVCQAHGTAPEELLMDKNLKYLSASNVDPLFCTLLLRLADLLDFDDTRAPKVLYSHVVCNEKSREEWDKHRASGGFYYPESPSAAKLPYKARCTNPRIEHAIQDFLDWIDDELNTCARLQQNCRQDWQRRFPFPRAVAREEIESIGYVSGDFQMTMDQTRVMDLLTGEQLYDKNDVFIRELLQNSIDATLLRQEMDQDFSQEDARIDLWEWNDRDGNIWFRIDDQGTGMTLGMIQRYFLKVGNSYYTSQELKRDLRDHKQTRDYHSISRFGIGFLSCFLCGTYAEVSTLYFDPKKNQDESDSDFNGWIPGYGLRLQVTELQGYYTLKSQAEQHVADTFMPAPKDYVHKAVPDLERDGYRAKPGTSISIKLDPGRLGAIDLRETVKEYLCCAKVPVYYNGERIGRTYEEAMDEIHELEGENIYELTPELKKKFDEYFPACAGQYPKVHMTVMPLDTEKNQMHLSMSGAFIKYDVKFDESPHWQVKGREYRIVEEFEVSEGPFLKLNAQSTNHDYIDKYSSWSSFINDYSPQEVKSLTAAFEALSTVPKSQDELGEAWHPFERTGSSPSSVWQMWLDDLQMKVLKISFHELGIHTLDRLTHGENRPEITCSYRGVIVGDMEMIWISSSKYMSTILLLLDHELRPTIKASRSKITDMPLELLVAIQGMFCAWTDNPTYILPLQIEDRRIPSLMDWRKLRRTKLDCWLRNNLRDVFKNMKEQFEKPGFVWNEEGFCIQTSLFGMKKVFPAFLIASLQDSCQMEVNYEAGQVITFIEKSSEKDNRPYDLFPPMMFCTSATQASCRFLCSGYAALRQCINVDHPYAAWLLKSTSALNRYYNRQFKQIIEALCNLNSEEIIDVCNEIRKQLLSLQDCHGIDMNACPQLNEADFWAPAEMPEDV